MMDKCETFTDCRNTIPLSFLKVSHLNTIPCGFYESPNEQNWMCELCTFSQIRSHMYLSVTPTSHAIAWFILILHVCMHISVHIIIIIINCFLVQQNS